MLRKGQLSAVFLSRGVVVKGSLAWVGSIRCMARTAIVP